MKTNTISLLKHLITLSIIWVLCSSQSCNEKVKHEEFVVVLRGEYAVGESATVELDGQLIGTATEFTPVNKKLTAGVHKLRIVTQNVPSVIAIDIFKTDDRDFIYQVNCDPAKVSVKVHQDYVVIDQTHLFEHAHLGGVQLTSGETTVLPKVRPVSGAFFKFIDSKGKTRYTINKTLGYGEEWDLNIPYFP